MVVFKRGFTAFIPYRSIFLLLHTQYNSDLNIWLSTFPYRLAALQWKFNIIYIKRNTDYFRMYGSSLCSVILKLFKYNLVRHEMNKKLSLKYSISVVFYSVVFYLNTGFLNYDIVTVICFVTNSACRWHG